MSVTSVTVLKTAGKITVETFEVLADILTSPWSAYQYCDSVGVPPFQVPAEWAPTLTQIRQKADVAESPEQWAEITSLAANIITGLKAALSNAAGPSAGPVESLILKVVLPVLLEVSKRQSPLIHTLLALAFFADQRLQDSYPQGLFAERWYRILGDLALKAGWGHQTTTPQGTDTEADWAPIVSDSLAAATVALAIIFKNEAFKQRLIRFWYGFDHPPIPQFADAQALAQHAFTLLLDNGERRIKAEDFDAALKPQPPEEPPSPLAFTVVPVPKAMGGKSKLFVQVHGQSNIEEYLGGGFTFKLTNGTSFGLLASSDGIEPIGNVSFQAELSRKASSQPGTGARAAVEFRMSRFSLGARAAVDDLAAWLKVEEAELAVTGGTWLDDFVPELRFTFNAEAEASVAGGVRFKGGAGGDVLIPVNKKIPILIGNTRVESLRLRAFLGDDNGDTVFRLEGAANLSCELFGILKIHVEGLGAQYMAGTAKNAGGNVAGIAKTGWAPVIPQGAAVELKVWKIVGGGAFFYDAVNDRLSGAVRLKFGDAFDLTGLGIYQRASIGGVKSWLIVVSLELPQSKAIFSVQGAGLIYGSNRTTSPEAFLAGIATGDLDAVLFPDDPLGKAPQYLAALERLFPTQKDCSVIGLSAKFSGFGGMLTLDLGVLLDFRSSSLSRVYILAQFVGLLRKPKDGEKIDPLTQPFRILADGVAIWDTKTDELNLRIALRNSRIWAAELTGEASLFHGSPESDGSRRGTYISVGGFHPDYVPPGNKIYVPKRLALTLSKGDHLKIEFRAYVAFTPSSLQFGISGRLEARFYGFGIRGMMSLDALIGFDGVFNIRFEFSVELLVGSRSLAAVRFVGTIAGFSPTVISGKAEVKFLFWTLSVSGSLTLHSGKLPEPDIDITGTLAAAISAPTNWETGGAPGLTLTDVKREGIWLSPTEPLRLHQPVVPLNVPIERFGSVRLPAPRTIRVERVMAGPTVLRTAPTMGEFALGMFLNLSQEEMLASRGYETREAGVEISRPIATATLVSTSAGFEEILLDPKKRPDVRPPVLTYAVASVFTASAGAGPATPAVRTRRERFVLVDNALAPQGAPRTFFEARALLKPGSRIVPETEVVA